MSIKLVSLLLIVFIIFAFLLAKDLIVKIILEKTVEAISGLKLSVSHINAGILNTSVRVDGLVILNPDPFPDRVMADINRLYVTYDISSAFSNQIHIKDMVFDVKLVNVIKNKDGRLNLNSLKIVELSSAKNKSCSTSPALPGIKIDKLRLKGGKVIYKDYTKTPSPNITEFVIDVDEEYENITNPYELASLIVSRSLVKTSPSNVIGFDITPLQNQFQGAMVKGVEAIKNTTEQFKKALQLNN